MSFDFNFVIENHINNGRDMIEYGLVFKLYIRGPDIQGSFLMFRKIVE